MNKPVKYLTIILFVGQIFIWIFSHSLLLNNSFSIAEKKVELEKICEHGKRIEKTIAKETSLSQIEKRSFDLNLIPVEKIVVLSLNQQFALQK